MCSEVVRFVSLEGKLKQFRRQLSEIHFDIKPESVGKCTHVCCVYRSHRWTGLKTSRLSRKILQTKCARGNWKFNKVIGLTKTKGFSRRMFIVFIFGLMSLDI